MICSFGPLQRERCSGLDVGLMLYCCPSLRRYISTQKNTGYSWKCIKDQPQVLQCHILEHCKVLLWTSVLCNTAGLRSYLEPWGIIANADGRNNLKQCITPTLLELRSSGFVLADHVTSQYRCRSFKLSFCQFSQVFYRGCSTQTSCCLVKL